MRRKLGIFNPVMDNIVVSYALGHVVHNNSSKLYPKRLGNVHMPTAFFKNLIHKSSNDFLKSYQSSRHSGRKPRQDTIAP